MDKSKSNTIKNDGIFSFTTAVIGGGLAGLSLSILLSKAGHKTILFEKERYPFHKVCGEYISLESWNFIEKLGLKLSELSLPVIKNLIISSPGGNMISAKLDLGGFGISRYLLDDELKKIAQKNKVTIFEETKVTDVSFDNEMFEIRFNGGRAFSKIVAGCFGKKSNLDVKWQRDFIRQKPGKPDHFIAVKYHIKNNLPEDTIALHNFKNGYCGVSKIENGKSCLCYLTTANNLTEHHNSIKEMEKKVLFKNPFLKKIFAESGFIFKEPVTISQINFNKKSQVENHVLMVGDSAGMITPLCGNGMSMAFHSSKIAFEQIDSFLNGRINREKMESEYARKWQKEFYWRVKAGRLIQKLFGKEKLTNLMIVLLKPFPFIVNQLVKSTHGKEF